MGKSINLKDFIENISYNKSQTYTRLEVLDEIGKFELLTIVTELPTTNIKTNKIYLVLNNKNTGSESLNRYDLYVYVNNHWEQIDSLELNIDDYYTKLNIDNLLDSKADYNHTHGLTTSNSDGFMSHYDKNKLDSVENEANKTIVDNSLNNGSNNPVKNSVITNALNTKVDKDTVIDNLESTSSTNVLSSKQGKVLKELVDGKTDIGHGHTTSDVTDNSAYTNIGSTANSTQKAINNSINTQLGLKADSSDVYTKNETYTKSEVLTEIINQISSINLFTIVTELPTTNIKDNKFYLVDNDKDETGNVYDIYVYVDNTWEKIDSLEFNLDDYYTKTETDALLDDKVDITDSRLTDSRNPKSHSHGNISNTGAIGSTSRKPLITTTNGVITTGEFGNSSGTFVEGDDSRLSDARTPVEHTHSKEDITDFPSTMTPSSHSHGSIGNDGKVNDDTASTNKIVVTDNNNNIKTINKLPSDKVTHQDITGKADSNHTHGAVQNNGTLNNDTESVNKIVVTDNNNNIKTISKLPNANITEQDITGKVDKTDIQDNLTSTDTDKPLSANQGRILKGQVDGKANTSHSHNTGEVTDTSAYGNIGSSANSTQKTINNNINTKLGLKADSSNVYTKTQTLTATEITTAIAEGVSNVSLFEVVTTLPTTNIKGNKFYLKSNNENNTENLYDIYIYVNNKWEKIDSLEFDIDNYYTITQIDNLLNGKVNTTDSRLTDSRTPKSHSHGNLTNTGAIGSTANKPLITTTNGVVTTGEFGTTSGTFVEGNDSRLSNARTPTSHTHGAIQNGGTLNSDTTTVGKVVVTDGSNNIKTISKLPSANVTHQDISGKVNTSDVKDNLTSTDTNKPLSAKQGKVLDEKISNIVSGNVDLSSVHQHDDRYYTESEIDTKLNSKVNTSDSRLTDARTPKFNQITATASNIQDLNDYKTGGFYYCNSDVNNAPYIIHCPWSNGTATPYTGNKSFFLLVETWGTTSTYVKQTLTYYTTNTTFTRTCSNGTWSTWAELSKNGHYHNSLPYVNTILAGEALTSGKLIGAKSDGKYYNLANELELDTTYPIYKVFSNVSSGSASNAVDFFSQPYAISATKSMTLTANKPVYIEGKSYSQGKFRVSNNIVTQTLNEGCFYINIGTAYDTANVRLWLADNTVHYYDGEKLVPCTENNYNIGGTNLIPNSQEFISTIGVLTGETYKGCNIRRVNNTSGTSYVDYTWSNLPKSGEFKQGDVFTLSFWAKGTGQLVAYNYGSSGYMTSRPIRTNGTPSATYGEGNCYFTLTDEWKRYYVTWVLNPWASDTALTVNKVLLLRTLAKADSYVCGVMFERGDTAHDWSPSPSDNVAEYIVGTQTASTSAWIGKSKKIYSLSEGTVIYYKLPYASTSTAVTLNLTLADGTTTGAKEVWFWNGSRVTTNYGVNSVVGLLYNGSQWWVINPSSNNSDGSLLWGGVRAKTGNASITANTLIGAKNDGLYYKLASGMVLDIRYPIVYLTVATNANTITTNIYHVHWNAYTSNNGFSNWTVPNMIYLEGTAYSKGQFTISSTIMTQTLVSGRYYIPLGEAESASQIKLKNLGMNVYYYDGTNFIPVSSWDGIKDKPSTFTPSSHTHPDTQITWNGTNTQNSVSPLDMAMYEEFSANRLAYLSGDYITVEYSTDGGSTWSDYGATATQKMKLITTEEIFTGGKGSTTNYSKNRLRITINAGDITSTVGAKVYLTTRKLMIYFCECDASNTKVLVEKAPYTADTTFSTVGTYDVKGWTGWNSIPLNITFGGYANQGTASHVKKLRLTFTCTGGTGNFRVQRLRLFGESQWAVQSNLARNGHLYSYDENQIATFPSNIVASKFIKNGVNNTNLLTANGGDVAQSTFATSGHTHSNYLTSHNPVDTALSSTSTNAVQNKVINTALGNKVDKAQGSGNANKTLSTDANGNVIVEAKNNHTHSNYLTSHNPVDSALSSTSTNAVQNKVINTALGNKVDKVSGKGLSTNDFTATYKTALDNLNTTIANAISNLEMIEVVGNTLPTTNIKTNKLYLKSNGKSGENRYDIYAYVNSAWEKIDSLDFSISDYIKKDSNTNLLLSNGTTKAQSSFITNSTGSVTSTHIADKTIVNGDIADATIETGKIKDSAVTSAKIADGTIVNADISSSAGIATSKISGLDTTLNGKENTSNKVTSISSSSTDTQYPSAKAVYNGLNGKSSTGHKHTGWTAISNVITGGSLHVNDDIKMATFRFGNTGLNFPRANTTYWLTKSGVTSETGNEIIPIDYRPTTSIILSAYSTTLFGSVDTTGIINVQSSTADSSKGVQLYGVWHY